MRCPKCNFEQPDGNDACTMCGVIFSRLNRPAPDPQPYPTFESDALAPQKITTEAWVNLGIGLVLAIIALCIPLARIALGGLATLVHEMGHSVFAWLFGSPSIPAFDLRYGGGIALIKPQSQGLLYLLYAAWAGSFVYFYRNRLTLTVLIILSIVWAIAAHTGIREIVILYMGHGSELVIAGLFIYRGLSGKSLVNPAERPVYSLAGFFLMLNSLVFSWGLLTSYADRIRYHQGKGSIQHDFIRIGQHLGLDLNTVVAFYFFCALLPILVAYLVYRYQTSIYILIDRLLERESE